MRELTREEALEIITSNTILESEEVYDFSNFRKSRLAENTFSFNVKVISVDLLISLMEIKEIQNVYYHPQAAPPGLAADSTSFRYRVHVSY